MRITEADMASKKRILDVRSAVGDAIAKVGGDKLTYIELLVALSEVQNYWLGCMLKDERKEENGDTDE